ncbi:FHA domain-containing protein [Candidatus Viridilinea mediisalina]|uniref:FHA domain-containing protein n=1 Tax=Candidatus Viridilinea mediisalina TaxID=2024553 RepID=A0A2A6RJ25_9CHLR|nr:FHA domain-containing protein [Candidatus Viridilinea mediisalina]PDW02941.1 hypothetical protein CJ255_11495 [Candidatus Viridilinea mediisalina]
MHNRLRYVHWLFALVLACCWLSGMVGALPRAAAQPLRGQAVAAKSVDLPSPKASDTTVLQAAVWLLMLISAMALSAGAGWIVARRYTLEATDPDAELPQTSPHPAEITTARRQQPTSSKAQWRAIVWDGQRRHRIALDGRQWSIGAAPGCNLCFPEAGLAALHARISLVGDAIEVTALEPGVFHTGLGSPLSLEQATTLGEGEALLVGTTLRVTLEAI